MTIPTTPTPPAWAPLETALIQRRPVTVAYHGRQRLLCPHALGWKNRRPMLLAYQTGGHTSTGGLPADPKQRWRNLFIDEIEHVTAADPTNTWQTADNYNPTQPFNAIDHVAIAITPDSSQPT
ncbi:MAG: hypothetical protein ACR2NJ_01655 [Acidimicrobiales bacterium]